MRPVKSSENCEPVRTQNLICLSDFKEPPLIISGDHDDDDDDTSESISLESEESESFSVIENDPSLEECSVIYFGGYLAKKCMDHFKCSNCEKTLLSDDDLTDKNDILLFYKNYNINDSQSLKTQVIYNVSSLVQQ